MVRGLDRGQMILIGAVLLATVIFGLSFLLNSLLFAGTAGADGSMAGVTQVQTADLEVQHSLRTLAVRVNHASRNVTATEVATALESNVTAFSRLYGEAKAAAGSATVTVAYDNATSTVGDRIVQTEDADFTDNDSPGTGDWWPVPYSGTCPSCEATALGWFTANVAVENTSTAGVGATPAFTVIARNGTGADVEYTVTKDGGNLTIDADASWQSSTPPVTCGATAGRALIDFYDGSAYTGACEFPGVGALDGPTAVRFENPESIEGQYSLVVNRTYDRLSATSDTYKPCNGLPAGAADPCVAPVIWSANVTTTIHNDRVSYESAYNLTVYAEAQ